MTDNLLITELVTRHGNKRQSLIPILQGVVEKESFISQTRMRQIAKELDISPADVYGTASFYSFLNTDERGKYVIRICKTIVCEMNNKDKIMQAIKGLLKINVGETSPDKKFTLLETNCLGWCAEGPAMLINDKVYTKLTPESVREILYEYLQSTDN
jgi:NADH:ubiquinone oxidoreductase subunit E